MRVHTRCTGGPPSSSTKTCQRPASRIWVVNGATRATGQPPARISRAAAASAPYSCRLTCSSYRGPSRSSSGRPAAASTSPSSPSNRVSLSSSAGCGTSRRRRTSAVVDFPAPGGPATTHTSACSSTSIRLRSCSALSSPRTRRARPPGYRLLVTLPPLIPRSVLFGNPDRSSPSVSPDARLLGYVAPLDGVLNVWVEPLDGSRPARAVTHDTDRGVRSYAFCHDDRHLLYVQDRDGDESWRLYVLDLETDESTPRPPRRGE